MKDTNINNNEVLTVAETAKLLKIGRVKAYELFHMEGFPYIRLGKSLRVHKPDLFHWLKDNLNSNFPYAD